MKILPLLHPEPGLSYPNILKNLDKISENLAITIQGIQKTSGGKLCHLRGENDKIYQDKALIVRNFIAISAYEW